jgi:23S rRNA (guanine1835-N2)-methyltransferase
VNPRLDTPFKPNLELKRYPYRKNDLLQAWDSADELILQHVGEIERPALEKKKILIINDLFGALTCSLDGFDVTVYSDSFLSSTATQLNRKQNGLQSDRAPDPILSRLEDLKGPYDLVLIRIPKNMSFFEDILCHLTSHLHSDSQIICGYMVKHQAKASFDLLNKYIGETHTSLAQKKARLIFSKFQHSKVTSPYPLQVPIEGFETLFTHHSNLFSREKLDIGTRFLLEHIPKGDFETILDLGCANGIIGIAAKKLNPTANIIFADESYMAVRSAEINYETCFPAESSSVRYLWVNSCEDQEPGSVDLVICNPPFHNGNTLTDSTAWQMFSDAYRALRPGGTIRIIGNMHLQYPSILKRIFGNSRIIANHPKFTIADATR